MRTQAYLKNITAEHTKHAMFRNLAHIMDTRVVDFQSRKGLLTFLSDGKVSLRKVENELQRLGYPIKKLISKDRPVRRRFSGLYEKRGK